MSVGPLMLCLECGAAVPVETFQKHEGWHEVQIQMMKDIEVALSGITKYLHNDQAETVRAFEAVGHAIGKLIEQVKNLERGRV